MQTLKTRFLLLTCSVTAVVLLSGCNVQGLFTKYGDDPKWFDPNAAAAVGATADAGGPGKAIYGRICAACHLGTGKGVPGNNIPPLAGSALAQGDPRKPIAIVLHGFKGEIVRNGTKINGVMAPWQDVLSDKEIADVLTYVRSSFGNKAEAVTVEQVAALRDETSSRSQAYTEAELP